MNWCTRVHLFTFFEQNIIHLYGFLRFHRHQNNLLLILTNVYKVGCRAESSSLKQTVFVCTWDGGSSKNTDTASGSKRDLTFLILVRQAETHAVSGRRLASPPFSLFHMASSNWRWSLSSRLGPRWPSEPEDRTLHRRRPLWAPGLSAGGCDAVLHL